ncbi:MAG: hypothetical protein ABFS39_02430 [Pseudomonadota bacterium]
MSEQLWAKLVLLQAIFAGYSRRIPARCQASARLTSLSNSRECNNALSRITVYLGVSGGFVVEKQLDKELASYIDQFQVSSCLTEPGPVANFPLLCHSGR